MANKKILFLDIETAPNLGYTWGKWEQNVIEFKRDWYLLSFSVKWLGENGATCYALPDFKGYSKDKENDLQLSKELWRYMNEADVIVAHNGDAFDIKKANARFIYHGLTSPSPYKTIDTKKVAKKYFRFDSNKLDDLGKYFGLGRKMDTGGFELWLGCMAGDLKSWLTMIKYNKQDVILLEKVYLHMLPWITNHPRLSDNPVESECPNCGSTSLQRRGVTRNRVTTLQRVFCKSCGAWHSTKLNPLSE